MFYNFNLNLKIKKRCWINGTFYVKEPDESNLKYNRKINYYQWIVPIIVFQCLLFSAPSLLWKFLIYLNGFDMIHVNKNLMRKLYLDEYSANLSWANTQKLIDNITDHFRMAFLKQKNTMKKKFLLERDEIKSNEIKSSSLEKASLRKRFPNLHTKPNFPLFFPYICVKLIYILNIFINFYFLSWIFNFNYFTYGYESLKMRLSPDEYSKEDEFFPKMAFCDTSFYPKKYTNVFSVACSLPVNLFNQLFYFVFWFWLIILAVITLFSIFYWMLLTNKWYRQRLVFNALQLDEKKNLGFSYTAAYYFTDEANIEYIDGMLEEKTGLTLKENFKLFFYHVCSCDVIFAIKLIALNSNSLAFRDILNNLWDHYLDLEDLKVREVKQRPSANLKRPAMAKLSQINESHA